MSYSRYTTEIDFPDPRTHQFAEWILFGEYYYNARDIVGFGGDLSFRNLQNAYTRGIFPWHVPGLPLPWFCPERRAVLDFSDLHVPRTLRREMKRTRFRFTIDHDFETVIRQCSKSRRGDGEGTWITADFIESFVSFHRNGWAHSIEVSDEHGSVVGGLYGVDAGGVFCGESMFYLQPNASKLGLLFLLEHLRERGASWIDIQVMTPHFKVLGAKELPRVEFLDKLAETQARGLKLF